MPLDSPKDLNYPQFAPLLEMDERDNKEGEHKRRIELGFERDGREKGAHKEHRHKSPIKESNFIQTT